MTSLLVGLVQPFAPSGRLGSGWSEGADRAAGGRAPSDGASLVELTLPCAEPYRVEA
jgi:hypothetical protein